MRKNGAESIEVESEVLKTSAVKFAGCLDVRPCILLFMHQNFDGPDDGSRGMCGLVAASGMAALGSTVEGAKEWIGK